MTNLNLTQYQAFFSDHQGHELSYESQEFIVCCDCDETLTLDEGTGVNVVEGNEPGSEIVFLEVPSGIANGHVTYTVDPCTGTVVM